MFENHLIAEDEREFDYIKGRETVLVHWGKVKKEWEACNNGDHQSPIHFYYYPKIKLKGNKKISLLFCIVFIIIVPNNRVYPEFS